MDAWLSKDEVNSLYYDTVAGQIAFATEAAGGTHSTAVARLVAGVADAIGRRQIRVLEIGANNCVFARKFLLALWAARGAGGSRLERVDYLAVEYSRAALQARRSGRTGRGSSTASSWDLRRASVPAGRPSGRASSR